MASITVSPSKRSGIKYTWLSSSIYQDLISLIGQVYTGCFWNTRNHFRGGYLCTKTRKRYKNKIIYLNMTVFSVVALCSLVKVYRRFRDTCCSHHQGDGSHHPDDGGSKYLWNVSKRLPDYTVLQTRRQPSSYSQPSERQILQSVYPSTGKSYFQTLVSKLHITVLATKIIKHAQSVGLVSHSELRLLIKDCRSRSKLQDY
jgi:hypothetical protein